METMPSQSPSTFAQLVDKLRGKSEEELKILYLKFFTPDLTEEWKQLIATSNFGDATEEDIVKAIQKNRYK